MMSRIPRPWQATILIAATVICGILLLYWETAVSIVKIWWRSGTYAHGFLIIPISAWLIWQKRDRLVRMTPQPMMALPWLIVLFGAVWLLAASIQVLIVQQLCLAASLITALVALLGWRVSRVIAFPIAFLVFAVPMGQDLVPPLMHFTAAFAVKALQLTGIPVLSEGMYITLPNGRWEVASACSGSRYLIASVTLGCLYAYVMYRSFGRRLAFVVASMIVPIIANGIRAYMIVMLGYLSGMKLAVGVDHIIYGWVLFGIVISLQFFIGAFWREDLALEEAPSAGNGPVMPAPAFNAKKAALTGLSIICAAMIWPLLAAPDDHGSTGVPPVRIEPPQPKDGWQFAPTEWDWRPSYLRPQGQLHQSYASSDGMVGLYVEYYRDQQQGAELIDSQNVLVHEKDKEWRQLSDRTITIKLNGKPVTIRQARLDSPGTRLLVWHWYWISGHLTINHYTAKLLEAKAKLFHGHNRSASIIVAARYDITPDRAKARLQRFVRDMYSSIERTVNDASPAPRQAAGRVENAGR